MKHLVSWLLSVLLLAACSNDDIINNTFPDGAIGFSDGTLTRGTPVENASGILSMGVFCAVTDGNFASGSIPNNYMNDVHVSRKSGSVPFSYSPLKYWPEGSTKKLSFFAYAPHSSTLETGTLAFTTTGGTPSLTYTVPSDVTKQPDLMVAVPKTNLTKTAGSISFEMKHVLTSIGFLVAGQGEKITAVKISGISTSGTLSVDGSAVAWKNLTPPSDVEFTAGIQADATAGDDLTGIMNGDGYLMMIPQTLDVDSKLTITLTDGSSRTVSLDQKVWKAGEKVMYGVTVMPEGTIVIDPVDLYLPSVNVDGKTDNFDIFCYDKNGNPDADMKWTLKSDNTWLTVSLNSDGSGAGAEVSGIGSRKVYTYASANSGEARTATLGIKRRPNNIACNVVQLKPVDFNTMPVTLIKTAFIGAFWRADQKGERIICAPINSIQGKQGKWSAYVAWMDSQWKEGDIVLNLDQSKDPDMNLSDPRATPGNAEDYPIDGDNTAVGGTVDNGQIYFRVALKSTFTPSAATPARYAVIVLSYGDNSLHYKIFLRQGHDPDYLMRPTDPYGNEQLWASAPTWRPEAKKFSPYNLTAANLYENDYADLDANRAVFVGFPTQAGSLFQWAGAADFERRAYHPSKAIVDDAYNWSVSYSTGFWSVIAATHEISPLNYSLSYGGSANFRRPNDGLVNATTLNVVAGSETRQSLFFHPKDGDDGTGGNVPNYNTIWGYYADGFFDRRMIQGSIAVLPGNEKTAYLGRLFFNPFNNASLFFPAAGVRSDRVDTSSALAYAGSSGYYLMASSSGVSGGILAFGTGTGFGDAAGVSLYMSFRTRRSAFSLRPVVE